MCMPYLISLTISLTIFKVRDKHPLKTWQHRWEEAMNPPCPRCPRCPRPQVLPSNHTGFVYGPCLNNEVSWEQRPSLRTILWQESPRTVHGGLAGFSGHLWANRRVMQLKDHRSQWSAAKRMCCFPEFSLKVASFLRRFPKCRGPQNPEERLKCSFWVAIQFVQFRFLQNWQTYANIFSIDTQWNCFLSRSQASSLSSTASQCHPRISNILPIHRHPQRSEKQRNQQAASIKSAHFWTHFKKNKWYLVC